MLQWLEYVAVRLAGGVLSLLPVEVSWKVGELLGLLAWVLGIRRSVAKTNVGVALAGAPLRERRRIVRRSFAVAGRTFVTPFLVKRLAGGRWRRFVRIDGKEHLESAFSAGRGVLVVTGHMGNWELMPLVVSEEGFPAALVMKAMHNTLVNDYCVRLRAAADVEVIERKNAARGVIRALKGGKVVGVLPDQDVAGGVFVRFMGIPTSTVTGPAFFAARLGVPVVCAFVLPEGNKYRLVFEPPLQYRGGDPRRIV